MKPYFLATIVLIFVFGCDDGLGNLKLERDIDTPIQTNKLEYTLKHNNDMLEMKIPQTFTNLREDTTYIVNCNGQFDISLQKQSDEEWIDAFSPILPQCLSSPIKIAPQSNFQDTLQVSAGLPSGNIYPKFQVEEIEGVYRLVWVNVLESFDANEYPFGSQIPLEQRVSNEFIIRVAGD